MIGCMHVCLCQECNVELNEKQKENFVNKKTTEKQKKTKSNYGSTIFQDIYLINSACRCLAALFFLPCLSVF